MSEFYYLALLVPLIITGIFYLYKKHEFTWWEFFIPIASVLVVIVISKLVIDHTSVRFTEYWGSSVVSVYEEEPYNYWQVQTCSRQVPCGTDSDGNTQYCTEYYDCSHQVNVPPSWWAITDIGEKVSISDKLYDELVIQFKTKPVISNSRKNHSANSRAVGSAGTKFQGTRVGSYSYVYRANWNGSDDTRKPYASVHTYVNKVKATDLSIFNIALVNEKQVDSLGLFRYPDYKGGNFFTHSQGFEFPTILGTDVSKDIHDKFRRLNGKYGVKNEMRLWVLVFEDKERLTANYQENYWVKGNMNELVLCIGKKGNEIQWSHAFSWAYSTTLTVAIQDKIMNLFTYKDTIIQKPLPPVISTIVNSNQQIAQHFADTTMKIKSPQYPVLTEETWNELYHYLNDNLHRFERRDFEEFNYLTVDPSRGAIIFIFIFAMIVSIAVNVWVTTNDIYCDDSEYSDKY